MKNNTVSTASNVPEEPGPSAADTDRKETIIEDAETGDTWHMVTEYREPGLKDVYHRVCSRIVHLWERLIHGKRVLTPAGRCFLNYCRAIVEGTQRPEERIWAYEEQLNKLVAIFRTDDGSVPKHVPPRGPRPDRYLLYERHGDGNVRAARRRKAL